MSDPMPAALLPSLEALGPRFAAFAAGLSRPLVFLDLETTGVEPGFDRIVEICLVRVMPSTGQGPFLEPPYVWRINPEMRIPKESTEIHGISNADVADAPRFADIADDVVRLLSDVDLAGFAVARFDLKMLQNELHRVGRQVDLSQAKIIDSQAIFHRREPRNLTAAVEFYCQRELVNAHGALVDTVASLEVFAGQLRRYEDLELGLDELHGLSSSYTSQYVDGGRRFVWRDNEPVFNFGKLRGKSLRWAAGDPSQREYLRWLVSSATDDDLRAMIRDALAGKIRVRPN
jgi:DNA polymerase-3 subunit epsilon